jgi:hypothetical protein
MKGITYWIGYIALAAMIGVTWWTDAHAECHPVEIAWYESELGIVLETVECDDVDGETVCREGER